MFLSSFRELSVGARRRGGEYEAILELLPKGKSGAPVKAQAEFSAAEVIFVKKWQIKVVSRARPRPYAYAFGRWRLFFLL